MADEMKEPPALPQAEQSANLYALLAARARRASDGRLVTDAALGTVALGVAVFVHPHWWAVVMPFVSIGALGFWGIADRELAAAKLSLASRRHRALAIAKWTAVVVGTGAAVVAGAMFMVVAMGTIIS